MASSVNGCGTKYYGERRFRPDGSYVTTNFFCLLFLPIFPVHSVRVIPDPKNGWMPFSKNYYTVLEKRAPNVLQVASIYLFAWSVVALIILYFARIEPALRNFFPVLASPRLGPFLLILTIVPAFIVLHILRSNARKRAIAQDLNGAAGIGQRN